MDVLLNESYSNAYGEISTILKTHNLALADVLQPIAAKVRELKMEMQMKIKLFKTLGDIE